MAPSLGFLCQKCSRLRFNISDGYGHRVSDRGRVLHFRNFDDLCLSAQSGCHLCTLIASGLKVSRPLSSVEGREKEPGEAAVYLEYFPSFCSTGFRIIGERLEGTCGSRWVPLYIENPQRSAVLTPGMKVWEENLESQGQTAYAAEDPLSDSVFNLINKWIHACAAHTECHIPTRPALPLRVIDVGPPNGTEQPRLALGQGKLGHYLTLSYRWGNCQTLTTTSRNMRERMNGINLTEFPKTMRDAIVCARRLGVRYLWIDALCILQDSQEDWTSQSAQMSEIYQNAWLNISADVAEECIAGFLERRNALEIRNCEHPTLVRYKSEPSKRIICPYSWSARDSVENTILTTRGWVLQERLHSKRILHWLDHEVLWECQSAMASERFPSPFRRYKRNDPSLWNKMRRLTVRHPRLTDTPSSIASSYDRLFEGNPGTPGHQKRLAYKNEFLLGQSFDPWYKLIEQYTERELTQPNDKLPAVSSIAALCKERSLMPRATYIAGLWAAEDLPAGLAWSVRRTTATRACDAAYRAPSFSWASVDGPVRFWKSFDSNFDDILDAEIELLSCDVSLAGSDEFGRVTDGKIAVRALARDFNAGSLDYFSLKERGYEPMFDSVESEQLFARCGDRALLVYLCHRCYIILVAKGEQRDVYERVGLLPQLEWHGADWYPTMERIKIIIV